MNELAHPVAAEPIEYPDYHRDGYGWAMAQAAIIRGGRLDSIDWENVAEEIESVGNSERSKYTSHLARVLIHMLKWEAQPQRRGMSWWLSIANERLDALQVLEENPSLKSQRLAMHKSATKYARRKAALQTNMPLSIFEMIQISQSEAFSREIPRPEGD